MQKYVGKVCKLNSDDGLTLCYFVNDNLCWKTRVSWNWGISQTKQKHKGGV